MSESTSEAASGSTCTVNEKSINADTMVWKATFHVLCDATTTILTLGKQNIMTV